MFCMSLALYLRDFSTSGCEMIGAALIIELKAYRHRMNSVAAKENRLKQVMGFPLNVFSTRFFYQAANSFADIKIPNRLNHLIPPPLLNDHRQNDDDAFQDSLVF